MPSKENTNLNSISSPKPIVKPGQTTLKSFFELKQSPASSTNATNTPNKQQQKENSSAKKPIATVVPNKK